jgi:hypothetical protein
MKAVEASYSFLIVVSGRKRNVSPHLGLLLLFSLLLLVFLQAVFLILLALWHA